MKILLKFHIAIPNGIRLINYNDVFKVEQK